MKRSQPTGPEPILLGSDETAIAKRHIAIVLAGLGPGGAEHVVSMLANHWSGNDYFGNIDHYGRGRCKGVL